MKIVRFASFAFLLVSLSLSAFAQQKQLTIEEMFKPGGILGRGPENVKWSPDGTKVSFVQRDDSGDQGELYYVDVATGKSAVLVASGKLASLAPPTSAIKDERKKEAAQRYSIAAYHWAPDSKHLLFDSMGQLWLYSLDTGTGGATHFQQRRERRSQIFARWQSAFLTFASTTSTCATSAATASASSPRMATRTC